VKATSVYHVFVSPKERLLIPKVSSQASDLTRHRTSVKNLFHKAEFFQNLDIANREGQQKSVGKRITVCFFSRVLILV